MSDFTLDTVKGKTQQIPVITARVGDWGIHNSYSFTLTRNGEVVTDLSPTGLQFEGIAPGNFTIVTPLYDAK